MPIVIAGTVRLPPENLDAARPVMARMLAASRAEAGCVDYTYAEDVQDRGLIQVFECWRDQAAFDSHAASQHIRTWRAAWPELGLHDRRLRSYEASDAKDF